MLFVPEQRRRRRLQNRDPRPRCLRRRSAGGADETPRTELILRQRRFVGFDEDGGFPANIAASGASHVTERAERAEQSNTGSRAAVVRRSEQTRIIVCE